MAQLHGFEEWLNDQGIIRNHTAKIQKMTVSFKILLLSSFLKKTHLFSFFRSKNMGFSKHHFEPVVQNSKTRDADIRFTWVSFARIYEVRI
jgi:hypothetical protein